MGPRGGLMGIPSGALGSPVAAVLGSPHPPRCRPVQFAKIKWLWLQFCGPPTHRAAATRNLRKKSCCGCNPVVPPPSRRSHSKFFVRKTRRAAATAWFQQTRFRRTDHWFY